MPTKSLLINYNDCPSSLDSLIPDNGLANLAGSLISKGHQVQILDYATISTLEDFRPEKIRKKLRKAFLRYKIETSLFNKMSEPVYKAFRDVDSDIKLCREKKINEIIVEISEKVAKEGIDFIGFKLWSGEGFLGSVKIAEAIKSRFPKLKIFAGGALAEVFGERILSYTQAFDVLCQAEGEEVIVELADFVQGNKRLRDIPNLQYKENGSVVSTPVKYIENLDSLAEPCYDESVYPALRGNEKIRIIMLEESRGCPYSCNFCIHRVKSGNKWRLRSIEKVINSLKNLSEGLNTYTFRLAGSNTPYFFRRQLAEKIIAESLKIKYIGFADLRQPEKEDYSLLNKSGCISLFFGVESADRNILENIINKSADPQWISDSLIEARKAGILTSASIIVPCPGESSESLKKTIGLLIKVKPYGVSVYPPGCFPKTKWYLESKRFGFELFDNFEEKLMTYTVKFTMPPPMLAPLPYKLDGRDFYQIIAEVIKVSGALEKHGITTGMNDSLLLIAHVLGISPKQVKHLNQQSMILGECEELRNKIAAFNARVKVK